MNKENVIIVGAGICGLSAARELSKSCNVVILEASGRLGGRIHSVEGPEGIILEKGAEFIHGKLPETLALAKEARSTVIPFSGRMVRREKGKWVEEDEMLDHWEELLEVMGSITEDQVLSEFLDSKFGGDKYKGLRAQAIGFASGFDLADAERASTRALYREWSQEQDQNFRIEEGYGSLISFLAETCIRQGTRIVTGDPVKQVEWQDGIVNVWTAEQKKYPANRLIVTVPLGVLQNPSSAGFISFAPRIDVYLEAAAGMGMGKVIRYVFGFSEKIWEDGTGFILSTEAVPTWWAGINSKNNTLVGWAGGYNAEKLRGRSEDELTDIAIDSLASIFDRKAKELKKLITFSTVTDWSAHEWSLGGYSYPTPETMNASALLNKPIENSIFFSGEALYSGEHPGTVEAAIVHGKEVARRVMLIKQ